MHRPLRAPPPDLVAAPTEVLVARVGATVQGYLVD